MPLFYPAAGGCPGLPSQETLILHLSLLAGLFVLLFHRNSLGTCKSGLFDRVHALAPNVSTHLPKTLRWQALTPCASCGLFLVERGVTLFPQSMNGVLVFRENPLGGLGSLLCLSLLPGFSGGVLTLTFVFKLMCLSSATPGPMIAGTII